MKLLKHTFLLSFFLFQSFQLTPGDIGWGWSRTTEMSEPSETQASVLTQSTASPYQGARLALAAGTALFGSAAALYSRYQYRTLQANYTKVETEYRPIIALFEPLQGIQKYLTQMMRQIPVVQETHELAQSGQQAGLDNVLSAENQEKFNEVIQKAGGIEVFQKKLETAIQSLSPGMWMPVSRDVALLTKELNHILLFVKTMQNQKIDITAQTPAQAQQPKSSSTSYKTPLPAQQKKTITPPPPRLESRALLAQSIAGTDIRETINGLTEALKYPASQPALETIIRLTQQRPQAFIKLAEESGGYDALQQYATQNPENIHPIRQAIVGAVLDQSERATIVAILNDVYLRAIVHQGPQLVEFIQQKPQDFIDFVHRNRQELTEYAQKYPAYFPWIIAQIPLTSMQEHIREGVVRVLKNELLPTRTHLQAQICPPQEPDVTYTQTEEDRDAYMRRLLTDKKSLKEALNEGAVGNLIEFMRNNPKELRIFIKKYPNYLTELVPQTMQQTVQQQFNITLKNAPELTPADNQRIEQELQEEQERTKQEKKQQQKAKTVPRTSEQHPMKSSQKQISSESEEELRAAEEFRRRRETFGPYI